MLCDAMLLCSLGVLACRWQRQSLPRPSVPASPPQGCACTSLTHAYRCTASLNLTTPKLHRHERRPPNKQDDAVTLWCLETLTCVLRGEGHQSWVTGVAFDYWTSRQPYYRFTSVGEDAQLCM